MGGFDTGAAHAGFGLADGLTPVVILAVGRHDSTAGLPAPLAAREAAPRTRHPVSDLLLPVPAAHPLAAREIFDPERAGVTPLRPLRASYITAYIHRMMRL